MIDFIMDWIFYLVYAINPYVFFYFVIFVLIPNLPFENDAVANWFVLVGTISFYVYVQMTYVQ
jgi:hypothetical protein